MFLSQWLFIHFWGLVTVRTEVKTKEPWWFLNFFIFTLSLSLSLWTWGLAKGSSSSFLFFIFLTRTQICTFDLWPPRCWLQAAAASPEPLYACWQPGSKGCKTLVASLHYSQRRRQPAAQLQSTTTGNETKHTHAHASHILLLMWK